MQHTVMLSCIRVLFQLLLLFSIHSRSNLSTAIAAQLPTYATSPYYQTSSLADADYFTAPMRIHSPSQLRGSLAFAPTPWAGPCFLTNNSDFQVRGPMILMHSADDCKSVTHATNDESQSYNGSFILFQDSARCDRGTLVNLMTPYGVLAVAFVRSGIDAFPMASWDVETSVSIAVHKYDGQVLLSYLQCRRLWIQAGSPTLWSSSGCASNYSQPIIASVIGTGYTTAASDVTAFQSIKSALEVQPKTITPGVTTYNSWSALNNWTMAVKDPCSDRVAGIWCEKNRIVSVNLEGLGLSGTLSPAWGDLSMLRHLNLGQGVAWAGSNGLTGGVPDSFAKLQNLLILILSANSIDSVTDLLQNCSQLAVLKVDQNQLQRLPSSFLSLQSLIVFDASNNNLNFIPDSIFSLQNLAGLNLQNNPLIQQNASLLSFRLTPNLESLLLRNIGLTGTFTQSVFDNLARLQNVELSKNSIQGQIPAFTNCTSLSRLYMSDNRLSSSLPSLSGLSSLTSLILNNNQIQGSIPKEWVDNLPSLSLLNLQRNQLNMSDIKVLKSLQQITSVDLSLNLLTIDPVKYSNDFGYYLYDAVGITLQSLILSQNQLAGTSDSGWIDKPNFRVLKMANNFLTGLPIDLFGMPLTYIDFSNNQLRPPFPVGQPRVTLDSNNLDAVSFIDLHNNPLLANLSGDPFSWVAETTPLEYIQTGATLCPRLGAKESTTTTLIVDVGFLGWSNCSCMVGYFGDAPNCASIPIDVTVSPFASPTSNAINLPSMLALDPLYAMDGNMQKLQTNARTARWSNVSIASLYPSSFTDRWYRKNLTSAQASVSLFTTYHIDLRSLSLTGTVLRMDQRVKSAASNFSSVGPQPVRVISIVIHLSQGAFRDSDVIEVYDYHKNLVKLINTDFISAATASNSTVWTPSANYSAQYSKAIGTLVNPISFLIQVSGNEAYINFLSTDDFQGQARFVATYSFSFDCSSMPLKANVAQSEQNGYECLSNPSQVTSNATATNFAYSQGRYNFECRGWINPLSSSSIVKLADPTSINYDGCNCILGQFGHPPYCASIPLSSILSPVAPISSDPPLVDYSLMANIDSQSSLNFSNVLNNSFSIPAYPLSITDNWFGSQRFSTGFSSNWQIDLRMLRNDTSSNSTAVFPNISSIPSSPIFQPVRVINVRLHIDRAAFRNSSNSISIFQGNSSSVAQVFLLVSDSISKDKAMLTSSTPCAIYSSYTTSQDYQEAYGPSLSTLVDPCLVEVAINSDQATIVFNSGASNGRHFVATYSYSFHCGDGTELNEDTNQCMQVLDTFHIPLSSQAAVYACSAVSSVWIIIQLFVMMIKWNSPCYRATSRPFLVLQAILLLILALSSNLYAEPPSTDDLTGSFICNARAWFTVLPITAFLAVLFAKTRRIDAIFGNVQISKAIDVSDAQILRVVLTICALQLVPLLVFSILGLSSPALQLGSGTNAGRLVAACVAKSNSQFWTFIIVEITFVLALVVLVCFFAFRTRHVPSAFNEMQHLFQCSLSLIVVSVFLLGLLLWLRDDPSSAVILQGCGQAIIAFIATWWMLWPKMFVSLAYSHSAQLQMAESLTNRDGITPYQSTNSSTAARNRQNSQISTKSSRQTSKMLPSNRTSASIPSKAPLFVTDAQLQAQVATKSATESDVSPAAPSAPSTPVAGSCSVHISASGAVQPELRNTEIAVSPPSTVESATRILLSFSPIRAPSATPSDDALRPPSPLAMMTDMEDASEFVRRLKIRLAADHRNSTTSFGKGP